MKHQHPEFEEKRVDHRRCSDCMSHSGVEARLDTHASILKTFDNRMYQMVIGTILTLMTAVVSMIGILYIASQTPHATQRKEASTWETRAEVEPAIIRGVEQWL